MAGSIDTTNLFSRLLPALSTNVASCGALTACSATQLTPSDLATIYGSSESNYKIMSNLITADFMGKAVGVRQNGMYDFLQANKRILGGKRLSVAQIAGGVWEVAPFIKMGRKRAINSEYWTVRVPGGTAADQSQTANLTVRIYSQSNIPADARWFNPGLRVFVSGKNAGVGVDTTYRLAFEVVSVSGTGTDDNGAYTTVVLKPQNASSAWYTNATASLANKAKIPLSLAAEADGDGGALLGLLVRGTPNVADEEHYCSEIPGLNTNNLVPFWIETSRYSICEDELTQRYIKALRDSNPFFKEFGDVESVELNRQIIEDWQRRSANNFFFGKPLANQTLADYGSLAQITLPSGAGFALSNVEGRCVGRRANSVGVYEQLSQTGRVKDLEAETLNLSKLFNSLHQLKLEREAVGGKSDVIELAMDSFYASQFAYGMIDYFKGKFGADVFRLNHQLNTGGEQGPFGFRFYRFELDYPQVELRIVTNPFFDDMLSAHKAAGFEDSGRMIWALDWPNIYPGIIDSNSVTNKTGDLKALAAVDETYACVMKVPTRTTKLNSVTGTTVVDAEATSFVLENIAVTKPAAGASTDAAYV